VGAEQEEPCLRTIGGARKGVNAMAEHPNVGLVKKGYEAFAKGDMATLEDVLDENMVWHIAGNNPLAGEYRGREAVFKMFVKIAELSGGTFRNDPHDVLANDEHAVALTRETASRGSKQLDESSVQVYHIESGKVTEAWSFEHNSPRYDEFWS
jgi:ketosteroid isomerase-like protein